MENKSKISLTTINHAKWGGNSESEARHESKNNMTFPLIRPSFSYRFEDHTLVGIYDIGRLAETIATHLF
jgi:hypothetical protein